MSKVFVSIEMGAPGESGDSDAFSDNSALRSLNGGPGLTDLD
jgi:hypothetical protein